METVVPIAGERGLPVEPVETLAEGSRLDDALALVRKHSTAGAIFSMHGDLMPMLLDYYESAGIEIARDREWPKGCIWVLATDSTGEVVRATYLPPPPA